MKGPTNQIQAADQISWLHGSHSIRAGFEYEWTNWPITFEGLQQGLELVLGYLRPTRTSLTDSTPEGSGHAATWRHTSHLGRRVDLLL